ncbi:MAG: SIS domain-containing protein [Desulfatibacillaceae bacterium]
MIKVLWGFLRTPVYLGRHPGQLEGPALVLFPCTPAILACGLAGFLAYKDGKGDAPDVTPAGIARSLGVLETTGSRQCRAAGRDFRQTYLGGEGYLRDLWRKCRALKRNDTFAVLMTDRAMQRDVRSLAVRMRDIAREEQECFPVESADLSGEDSRDMMERLDLLRDAAWCVDREVVASLDQVAGLMTRPEIRDNRAAIILFKGINAVLSSIDRLEVRGRDSAGISVMLHMHEAVFRDLEAAYAREGLDAELRERMDGLVLTDKSVSLTRSQGTVALCFTYKVAAEIGSLGDNVAYLREQVAGDGLLQLASVRELSNHSVLAHTRWASVGAITVPNCHPADNTVEGRNKGETGTIHVALNGDIDNFLELKQEFETGSGCRIPSEITTDTKIIPIRIEKYLELGHAVEEAFRLAVCDFTGSHAVCMHTDLAPGKLFMAQRGSGQTMFVGIGDQAYFPASEVYGLVEETSRFVKLNGEKAVQGISGRTQGQVFVLDQEIGGLDGITACYYDGTSMPVDESLVNETRITSRDIDRQQFPHYFLKEITESPESVEKTLQGRWRMEGEGADRRVVVDLDETTVPHRLRAAIAENAIRKVFFIGQGTAGVAASACADILRHFMKDSLDNVAALKASEFSGFHVDGGADPDSLNDTLVVAITQSGTTTDTNRAVDMVKAAGVHTMAIVNRRDSDITFKVDGVLYTSSGRDIEMSVASTKAFYSQIVAGAIFGLYMSRTAGVRDDSFVAEQIRELLDLPANMRRVLAIQDKIEASAKRLAPAKTYWAVVGSGPNKAAADEIRIKLSELCYKTISTDYVEDKKHIDLSSEPLIIVCAAGSPEAVLSDIVKDVAIFSAHKASPVVVVDEGENRFDAHALDVIPVPSVPSHLAPIMSTLAGHIWGYHAALAINESSAFLYTAREQLREIVERHGNAGLDVYELLLESDFREAVAEFYARFRERRRKNRFPSALSGNILADLTLLAKYLTGRLPVADFKLDFGLKGTPSNMLHTLFTTLGLAINDMARPVDAIKHQAKTVTVGTSRIAEKVEGLLFDIVVAHGFRVDQLTTKNVLVLKNLQEIVANILGTTLYRVEGLSLLGEPTDDSTITVLKKEGTSGGMASRAEQDRRLAGSKRIIVRQGNVYLGKGRKDNRSILVIPVISGAGESPNSIEHLLLLHVGFREDVPREKRAKALGGKYEHIKNLVNESNVPWDISLLDLVPVDELFGRSAEKVAEQIVARVREPRRQ